MKKVKETNRVLITDDVHPLLLEGLQQMGYAPDFQPEIQQPEVMEVIGEYVGIVISTKIHIDDSLLERGASLRWVARAGSGLENIDINAARKRNVDVVSSPEGNRDAVAEHVIGMMLSLLRNIPKSWNEVKNHQWIREGNRGTELGNKVVAIIGYGNTGSALARKLSGFGCEILVYDKYKRGITDNRVKESTMTQIFERADILSLHVPLTQETYHMVNDAYIRQFKKPVMLVNSARGKVVDTKALLRGLDSGRIKSAALDVLENEDLPSYTHEEKRMFQELTSRENVIITPHIAGWTFESKRKIAEVLLKKISEGF